MALTDHDTVAGLERAQNACLDHGIEFINGVELTVFWGREVHLLGYFIDPHNTVLQDGLKTRTHARLERVREMCHRLDRLGYVVYPDQIIAQSGDTVGRPHIARALVAAGHVKSVNDAFTRFLRNGGAAYVPASPLPFETGLQWIHDAGGLASIAHPSIDKLTSKLATLADMGIDAIEVRHPSQPSAVQGQLKSTARHLGLQITGGSDLHAPSEYRRPGSLGITSDELMMLKKSPRRSYAG